MSKYDTKCPYWDHVSLNNVKPSQIHYGRDMVDVTCFLHLLFLFGLKFIPTTILLAIVTNH